MVSMRRMSRHKLRSLLALVLGLALSPAALPGAGGPERIRNHFDSDAPLREPGFFDFVTLGAPGDAQWKVIADFNPPSTPNAVNQVITERPAGSIATALRRNVRMTDGTLTVFIKKIACRAGLVFRMADEKNYVALLVDPVSGNARLVRSENGKTTELARGHAEGGDMVWQKLVVTLAGPKVTATWSGKPLVETSNVPAVEGRVGIATEGPGLSTFDEFVIDKP
jgi:hypothetical protein